MMQQLNQKYPDNYLLAMRVLWAPIGLMIIFWIFIPESPWFHARRGDKENMMKCMRQLYGGIEGYDFEEEGGIIMRTIEHEREFLQDKPSYIHIFKGLNLVSSSTSFRAGNNELKHLAETHPDCHGPGCLPANGRSRYNQHVLNLCVMSPSPTPEKVSPLIQADFFSLAGLSDPFLDTVILS